MSLFETNSSEINDPQRLAALGLSGLLDTPPEAAFDKFTALAQQILGVSVALISLVDEDRQFFKSQVGLPEPWAQARQTPLSHSFCQYVITRNAPLIVNDAHLNPLVKENLAVSEIGVVAYAGVPLRTASGQVIGAFCALDTKPVQWTPRDIEVLSALAEMVMREVALRQMTQQLDERYRAIKTAEERRDSLVNMLVHDLRTPLTSLVSGLYTLNEVAQLDGVAQNLLDISARGAKSLSRMIDTILDVSRAEAGLLVLDREPVLPLSLAALATEEVEQLILKKSLSLALDIAPEMPVFDADKAKLKRVLINLLGNAIYHTPSKGRLKISVEFCSDEENFLWCVSDTGSGIPTGELENIFEKFGQVASPSYSQANSGLGLTFCKLVVEAHGGRIWAESQLGQGSQFYFTIPPATENSANETSPE